MSEFTGYTLQELIHFYDESLKNILLHEERRRDIIEEIATRTSQNNEVVGDE